MESLTLCQVSIFSNYLHFNYEQIINKLNNTFGNFISVYSKWNYGVREFILVNLEWSRDCEKNLH